MSELRLLDLNGNELQGVIPHLMLTRLTQLEKLHLHMNDLFGHVPTEIGKLKNLKELTMFGYVLVAFFISLEDISYQRIVCVIIVAISFLEKYRLK